MKKFAVEFLHRDYFAKNQSIEFEDLISQDQIASLQNAVMQTLYQRIGLFPAHIQDLYAQGRDLWRSSAAVKKWVAQPQIAHLAGELCEKKQLRLAFDQYLPTASSPLILPSLRDLYRSILEKKPSLAECCSIQGIACGLILCLKEPQTASSLSKLFSFQAGSGVFFSPALPLDFSELEQRTGGEYLLVAYAEPNAVFVRHEDDFHANSFKKLGYSFGDKLNDKLNPQVLK